MKNTTVVKKLRTATWEALCDYNMLEPNDKIMVCLSGGKDSYTLLDMLLHYQQQGQVPFELIAVNLDQKQPGFPEDVLPKYLKTKGVPFEILEQDTYSVVTEKVPEGKTMCSLCSRLRRGHLYKVAKRLGATKIALGHHREDILETFFLNLFFGGRIEAMPPKYLTNDEEHIVIRPLAYCHEALITTYAEHVGFPIIPCNLCGSQPNMQRQHIKKMIANWEEEHPGRTAIMFRALKNISPSHMLDGTLHDFEHLTPLMKGLTNDNTFNLP